MAWTKPSLSELIARVESDFSTKFFGTAATLRRSVLKVLSRVWAGLVYLLHLYLDWIYNQCFIHLADDDQLDRHGQEVGVFRKPAAFANGPVMITGTPGVLIEQGTLLQTPARVEYQTTADVVIGLDGIISATITAILAGANGNQTTGTTFELISPIIGVDAQIIATAPISEGADREGAEAYRARLLYRKRNPPQGGADADYVAWATSVSPVTDCWVFPQFPEANSVSLRVANYNASSPVLSGSEVQDVVDYVTDRTRRPVTADVRVKSVTPSYITVKAKISPFNPTTKSAADTELVDYFRREGIPAATLIRSQIQNALSGATGMAGAVVTEILQDGVAVENITLSMDQVAFLGTSIYTEFA